MPDIKRCPTCNRRVKRSTEANRRYFKIVSLMVPFVYKGRRWSKVQWHEYFKDMFIHPETIELPDGSSRVRDPRSEDMDVDEFNEYMAEVEAWCAEQGIWLEE